MANTPGQSPQNTAPSIVPSEMIISPSDVGAAADVPAIFETARLRLRPWRDTDAPGPGQGPDLDSLRFMPAGAQPGPDDFHAWLARRRRNMETGGDLHWCLAELASDTMVGNVQIFRMGPPQQRFQAELGYWLRPGARGHGFIGEAIGPVTAHALRPIENGGLGLSRLHAATNSDNYASRAVLLAGGFSQWGADHQAWRRSDGSLSDGIYFELLAANLSAGSVQAVEPITLEGKEVRLRKWRRTDVGRVVEACSDERTNHWLAEMPSPYTLEQAHSYLFRCAEEALAGKGLTWCVADSQSGVCLGAVAIGDLRQALGTAGEVGYWAHPEARGRGLMSEGVRLAVGHAFLPCENGGLGRQRLRLLAADGNSASQHVALANGFVKVGQDRQAEPLGDGTFVDLIRYDLLVDEWNARG